MNPGGQGVGWNIPSGNREWSALGGSDYGLEGFNTGGTGGAIGMGQDWGIYSAPRFHCHTRQVAQSVDQICNV